MLCYEDVRDKTLVARCRECRRGSLMLSQAWWDALAAKGGGDLERMGDKLKCRCGGRGLVEVHEPKPERQYLPHEHLVLGLFNDFRKITKKAGKPC